MRRGKVIEPTNMSFTSLSEAELHIGVERSSLLESMHPALKFAPDTSAETP
jgi:hypothetical protein